MLKGSILQKLRDAHRPEHSAKRPLNFGVYYKNTLVALCHALEDSILTNHYSPLMITAFQRGKWYLQEADRYGDIAEQAQQIVIMAGGDAGFAGHPTSQRSNVALVKLDTDDPVAQEWHLIILSPNYTAMVLCQELSEEDYGTAGLPNTDLERKFYGFWTFEPKLVLETAKLAIEHVGRYDPELQQALMAQVQAIEAHAQQEGARQELPIVDQLGDIVARVVDYLRSSQHDLNQNADYQTQTHHLDNNLLSNELQAFLRVAQLLDQSDLSNPMAAAEVATLAEAMGQLLDLPAWQLNRLRLAGLLHRLAFLEGIEETGMFLHPGTSPRYQDDAPSLPLTCPLVPGTQVLRKMPRLRAIATILTHQLEWWNGTGKPAGLVGDEIPIESRILGLVAHFQKQVAQHRSAQLESENNPLATALANCQQQQGGRWDPKLVDTLALLVNGLQQGLNLSVSLPKIAAGIWLLDSHSEDSLLSLYQDADSSKTTSTPVA